MPNPVENNKNSVPDAQVERWVYDALRHDGKLLPVGDEDIARLKAELAAKPISLPEDLQDPGVVYERMLEGGQPRRVIPLPVAGESAEDLARAARDGGEIPPEVEEMMKRDREAARRDKQRGK